MVKVGAGPLAAAAPLNPCSCMKRMPAPILPWQKTHHVPLDNKKTFLLVEMLIYGILWILLASKQAYSTVVYGT